MNLGIRSDASNVSVLDFSPLSPWMTLNTGTGLFEADTSNATLAPASIKPGIYHFAVKGTYANVIYVEEFSVGVYETNESELSASQEFYYDDDDSDYEEIVTYASSFPSQTYDLK